jgi:murein L,D-transpeptidase YcbB/YkuD
MEVYFTYILKNIAKRLTLGNKHLIIRLFTFTLLSWLVLSFSIISCGKTQKNNKGILPDSSVYSNQNFSSVSLDSTVLLSFYLNHKIEDSIKTQITAFYTRRNYQYAWFNQSGLTEACHVFYNQLQSYTSDFDDKDLNPKLVDSLINFAHDTKRVLTETEMQNIELLLTSSYFKYAEKSYGGIAKSTFDLEWFIPRKKKDYETLLNSIVSTNKISSLQEPVNQYYKTLIIELRKFKNIEKKAKFIDVKPTKIDFKLGEKDSCLYELKSRLFEIGDLKTKDTSSVFDKTLELSLKNFQKRHGLTETGVLNKNTLTELNTPISKRIKQIMVNLERLRWLPQEIEPECIIVNIPEFKLHVFENHKPISESKVVVGKMATQTSIFRGELSSVVLNPYWGIPNSIAVNEILPKLKKSTAYLSRNRIEVFRKNGIVNPNTLNWSQYHKSLPYNFRQKPGVNNSLGKIKFLFPNNYSIYLHDTPSQELFGETNRAFSHGCIRVQNPRNLAEYILRNDPKWTIKDIENVLKTDIEKKISIKPVVPVYLLYLTAWVDHSGQLNFRKDIYGLDKKLAVEIFATTN